LRRNHPGLGTGPLGDVSVDFETDQQWLVMRRAVAGVAVGMNLGESRVLRLAGDVLLSSTPALENLGGGLLVLPPDSVVIVSF
ncbi:MAG: DUF3459 domain-containing protein, partial [Actinomycetota bacterium]|nr:DUF3459 domain-containing protein [Actinomycetota bacterium]